MEKNALLNAISHGGKADVGAVMGKSMGESPDLRSKAGEVSTAAAEVVNRINSLSAEEQQALLEELYPDALRARDEKKALQKADEKAHASSSRRSPTPPRVWSSCGSLPSRRGT